MGYMIAAKELYTGRISSFKHTRDVLKQRLIVISFLRLLSFGAIIFCLLYITKFSVPAVIVSSGFALAIFLYLVKRYNAITRKKEHLARLITINENEVKAVNYEFHQFEDGMEFIDHKHPFTFDLDIFGTDSVFQFINRTVTLQGKRILASWLSGTEPDIKKITAKQEAIRELASQTDQRQNFQAAGKQYSEKEDDITSIRSWLSEPAFYIEKKIYHMLAIFLPLSALLMTVLTVLNTAWFSGLVMVFLIQLLITGAHLRINNRVYTILGVKLDLLKKYGILLHYIEVENYGAEILQSLRQKLASGNQSARSIINQLSGIVSAYDNRLNLFAGFLLNGFLLWDIQCMLRLEKWKKLHHEKIDRWFVTLGEFDAYCSLANFAFNNPDFCYGKPGNNTVFHIEGAGHPLINPAECVKNNLTIESEGIFIIITGANMAGKSTFLRTAAVNFILAMCGAPVCASEFTFSPMQVFTSMRTSDILLKNESYFYAELKRLKELIEMVSAKNNVFIVLDEILKGTNSIDKQKGSKAFLEQLISHKGTGLIATHDLELASLEEKFPGALRNMCFEIEIRGAEIFFDYILYDGITQKMNALLLMKQMGILPQNE